MSTLINVLAEWSGKIVGIFLLLVIIVGSLSLLWDLLSDLRNRWRR